MNEPAADPRRHSPAADRNKGPIVTELLRRLPAEGRALEIASGTGQHAVHFAAALPGWHWQPTDAEPAALASIAALSRDAGLRNIAPPLLLDLLAITPTSGDTVWPVAGIDLVYCANLLHISPWATTAALMRGSARCLEPGGRLVTYGPYRVDGEALAPGNLAFDADLRQRDPAWGLRWLHEVAAEAQAEGLVLQERIAMPANNLLLVFGRSAGDQRHRVRVEPAGWEFEAPSSQTVLASAAQAHIRLPNACRNGSCRRCLSRLRRGSVAYAVDWPGLSAEEKADGWTLPCVAIPLGDLVLEAPAALQAGENGGGGLGG